MLKCDNYTIESFLDDSCITCHENYFQIYNDNPNQNLFVKCYQNPKGYYLDNSTKKYKECYISCETCIGEGNENKHNCLSCMSNYSYILIINESINCYQSYESYSNYNSIDIKDNFFLDFSCPKNFDKFIPMKNKCIDDCQKDSDYKYEFNHTCYRECPYISVQSETKDFYCEVKCPFENPYELIETQNCVNNCTIKERGSGLCKINFISNEEKNNKEIEEKVVESIKEELTNSFDTSDVDGGKDIVIEQKDSTVTITTTENQKNEQSSNLTTIDLGECETKLKDEYHIPKNKSLYILKIDVKQKGLKIPKIIYEVYYPLFGENLIKLNLTACEDKKIGIFIPIVLTEDIDIINPKSE